MSRSASTQATGRPAGKLAAALDRRRARRLAAAASLAPRRVDPVHAHVAVRDATRCASACPDRACTFLCPAAVFDWRDGAALPLAGGQPPPPARSPRTAAAAPLSTAAAPRPAAAAPLPAAGTPLPAAGGPLRVRYDLCVECGACRIFCPLDNIDLRWPRGGFGIRHRFG